MKKKTCLLGLQTTKHRPVLHVHSLVSAFVICSMGSIVSKFATTESFIFTASVCSCSGLLEYDLVRNTKERFCHNKAHIINRLVLR